MCALIHRGPHRVAPNLAPNTVINEPVGGGESACAGFSKWRVARLRTSSTPFGRFALFPLTSTPTSFGTRASAPTTRLLPHSLLAGPISRS